MNITISKSVTINGQQIKVHGIATGFVAVRTKLLNAEKKTLFFALIDFFRDKKFADPMPIWTWVIEHPEGTFLIDTGENANVNDKDYFKLSGRFNNWLNTTKLKFYMKREDEIDVQLQKLNINTKGIKTIILTHLHLDHTDGIRHFPHTEILVNRLEWEKPTGNLPELYPSFFKPTTVELTDEIKYLGKGKYLTEASDLFMVHTPGHTRGHCSVVLRTDDCYLFFVGDVFYYQKQLLLNKFAMSPMPKASRKSYDKIKQFAINNPTVLLPSHDIESLDRLQSLEIVQLENDNTKKDLKEYEHDYFG